AVIRSAHTPADDAAPTSSRPRDGPGPTWQQGSDSVGRPHRTAEADGYHVSAAALRSSTDRSRTLRHSRAASSSSARASAVRPSRASSSPRTLGGRYDPGRRAGATSRAPIDRGRRGPFALPAAAAPVGPTTGG